MNVHPLKHSIKVVVLLVVLFSLLPLGSASAALVTCRTDPIVYFSDGSMVVVAANIETDLSQLNGIHYKLQVPAGLTVTRVVYTDRMRGQGETIEVIDNQNDRTFIVDVLVNTKQPGVVVKAQSALVYRASFNQTASGVSGQPITMYLQGK